MARPRANGFTVIGAVILAGILGASIAMYGIINFYVQRAKASSQTKVSVIDSESTLVELVASRFRNAIIANCGFTQADLANQLAGATFSDNTITLRLIATGVPNGVACPADAPPGSCNPPTLATAANPGVYLFSVRIQRAGASKNTTSFLESGSAFVQFRLELTSQSTPQNLKIFGPALACNNWPAPAAGALDQRQIIANYRIIWRRPVGNNLEVLSHMGSKTLNLAELR